jgi:hypothetical protein
VAGSRVRLSPAQSQLGPHGPFGSALGEGVPSAATAIISAAGVRLLRPGKGPPRLECRARGKVGSSV